MVAMLGLMMDNQTVEKSAKMLVDQLENMLAVSWGAMKEISKVHLMVDLMGKQKD